MSSDDESCEKECPLCVEPLELDDLNFYPCKCEYQICRFCWHRIRTDANGLCPGCRQPYPEDPVNFKPLSAEELQRIKNKKKAKQQQQKQKMSENRKHLANLRVLQDNLVYVVGLSTRIADAETLKKPEYFGKFGKMKKVAVGNTGTGAQNASCTAYVTYYRSEDALRAIQNVNNVNVDGKTVRASLGTTKYCSSYLRNQPCHKPECMYLHELAKDEASFTKEDMQLGKHTDYEKKLHEQMLSQIQNINRRQDDPSGRDNGFFSAGELQSTSMGEGLENEDPEFYSGLNRPSRIHNTPPRHRHSRSLERRPIPPSDQMMSTGSTEEILGRLHHSGDGILDAHNALQSHLPSDSAVGLQPPQISSLDWPGRLLAAMKMEANNQSLFSTDDAGLFAQAVAAAGQSAANAAAAGQLHQQQQQLGSTSGGPGQLQQQQQQQQQQPQQHPVSGGITPSVSQSLTFVTSSTQHGAVAATTADSLQQQRIMGPNHPNKSSSAVELLLQHQQQQQHTQSQQQHALSHQLLQQQQQNQALLRLTSANAEQQQGAVGDSIPGFPPSTGAGSTAVAGFPSPQLSATNGQWPPGFGGPSQSANNANLNTNSSTSSQFSFPRGAGLAENQSLQGTNVPPHHTLAQSHGGPQNEAADTSCGPVTGGPQGRIGILNRMQSEPAGGINRASRHTGATSTGPESEDLAVILSGARLNVQSTTDWQVAFGLKPFPQQQPPLVSSVSPPRPLPPITDDDLGFDPFSESSKGLADLLEEEEEAKARAHRHQQHETDRLRSGNRGLGSQTSHLFPSTHRSTNSGTENAGVLNNGVQSNGAFTAHSQHSFMSGTFRNQAQQPQTLTNKQSPSNPQQVSSSLLVESQLRPISSPSSNFTTPPPGFPLPFESSKMYQNGPMPGFNGVRPVPPPHTSLSNMPPPFGGFPPGPPPPPHMGGRETSRSASPHPPPPPPMDPFNMQEWQEGLRSLFPNVNVRFSPNLQPKGLPGGWMPSGPGGPRPPPPGPPPPPHPHGPRFSQPPPPLSVSTAGPMGGPPMRPSPTGTDPYCIPPPHFGGPGPRPGGLPNVLPPPGFSGQGQWNSLTPPPPGYSPRQQSL